MAQSTQDKRQIGRKASAPAVARDETKRKLTLLDAVRAFGVTVGPSALFDLFLAGSVAASIRWLVAPPRALLGKWLRPIAALGTALAFAFAAVIRPWMLRWGATDEERRKPLPGDELVPAPAISSTRAITVNAPTDAVWPWLAQIGQDRGGFYSYEWLENLAGCRLQNADRIHPEWQRREIGEVVKLHPATGCKVAAFEPNRALVLAGWGAFVVEPLDASPDASPDTLHSRVIVRSRTPGGWVALLQVLLIELPHFVMERKMLLGIKRRAEHAWQQSSLA